VDWKYKAAIQNVIGKLPASVGNPIYYQLQRRFGGLQQTNPMSRLRAGIEVVRRIQQVGGSVESAAFLEVGTGHQLALPLSLWLCGAGDITTVDLNRYLKESLVLNDIQYLRRHQEETLKLFRGICSTDALEKRFERLLSASNSLQALFGFTKIRYWAPADAARLPFEPNSIDYHVSFTVLEHIAGPILKRIFREGRRVLNPNGLFVHCIDFTDHFAHSDRCIPSIHFLQFSEDEWERLAGNRYMFHNRLRIDEFQKLLLQANLQILALDSNVDPQAVALLRNGFPLDQRFRNKDLNTNAARDAWLVARP
jgi:SAM-dependent methyltransferase